MYWESSNSGWALKFNIYNSSGTLQNTIITSGGNPQTINQPITLLNTQYFTISWTNISFSDGTHTINPITIILEVLSSPLLTFLLNEASKKFIFSQIAVIDSNKNNIAVNKMVRLFINNQPTPVPASLVNNIYYQALPMERCYISPTLTNNTYLEIDLAEELDVTAVHIYNTSDTNNNQEGLRVQLYTEDKLLAIEALALTNNRKEVIPFLGFNIDSNCSTEPKWPIYYGVAGIITRYIRLMQTRNGDFGFSKVEIIDKNGRDIGIFKPVTATSNQAEAYLGVSNRQAAATRNQCYVATTTSSLQSYIIDLQWEHEICAINVYGCTDAPNLTNNINIELFRQLGTSLATRSMLGSKAIESFDFRYNSEDSTYPTQVVPAASAISYGLFGTMCDTVIIPFPVQVSDPNAAVVESTGNNLFTPTNVSYSEGRTIVSFGYMADITSVTMTYNMNTLRNRLQLTDCNNNQVADQLLKMLPTNSQIMYADFRNPTANTYAPLQPLQITYGSKGTMAQYIRVIPRDTTTPLYVSQVIAVDSSGVNVSFEADTFTVNSSLLTKTPYAVDGNYEAKMTDMDWLNIFFTKYRQKLASESFVSIAGSQEQNFLLIDLGKAKELNSVIYVVSSGYNTTAKGVIIQLMDSNLKIVGVQLVSQIATMFGIDILDFRLDKTESYLNPRAGLEIKQRNPELGKTRCGVLVQYIRIQQLSGSTPIQMSQVIAIDSKGFNVALYKPTYATSNNMITQRVVDGGYYKRPLEYGFKSASAANEYLEINLTKEMEIVNVYIINLLTDPDNNFGNMRVVLYNATRDVVMVQNLQADLANGLRIPADTTDKTQDSNQALTSFSDYPKITKIGVSLQSQVMAIRSDLNLARAFVNTAQIIPSEASSVIASSNCASDLSSAPRFIRGAAYGIPTRKIRIYNPGQYIQISQIQAFGPDGTNVALGKPCTATTVLPGLYVSRITDGQGGFFHTARPESQSYVSGLKRYNFVDIDLETDYEIVGVKYIPPSSNYYRNIGLTIQLLSADDVFLAQYAITSATVAGVLIDFRYPIGVPESISQIIAPHIDTYYSFSKMPALTQGGGAKQSGGWFVFDQMAAMQAAVQQAAAAAAAQAAAAASATQAQAAAAASATQAQQSSIAAQVSASAAAASAAQIMALAPTSQAASTAGAWRGYAESQAAQAALFSTQAAQAAAAVPPAVDAAAAAATAAAAAAGNAAQAASTVAALVAAAQQAAAAATTTTTTTTMPPTTTMSPTPSNPTITSSIGGNGTLTLNWTPPTNNGGFPISYDVGYSATSGGTNISQQLGLTGTTATFTGIPPGKYFASVRCKNTGGGITPWIYSAETFVKYSSITPIGIAEDSAGNLYYTDTYMGNIINLTTYTTVATGLNYPAGLACDGTSLYVADYGNNAVKKVGGGATTTLLLTGMINPYGVYYNAGKLYCTEYKMAGRIFVYDTTANTFQILTQTFNYPASVIVDNNSTIYVTSAYDKIVYTISTTTVIPKIGLNLPISIALSSPNSLTYDASSNIIFLADYAQNKVYSIDKTSTVIVIAGTGTASYTGDKKQGNLASLNRPMFLYYSKLKGYLFISDFQNNAIRYINLYSGPPIQIQSTTTYNKPSYYTTTTLVQSDVTINNSSQPLSTTTKNTYSILANPSSIQNTYTDTASIDSFVFHNNTIYFASAFKLYTYNIENLVKTHIGGTGESGYYGDNSISSYKIGTIACMIIKDNMLYLCDRDYSVIRTLNLTTNIITTFMGAYPGWTPDGSTPLNTSLKNPTYIGFDNNGIFYVSDAGNYCIRRINTTNRVQTVVGSGKQLGSTQYSGNVQSTAITLGYPTGFVFDENNNLIFCDSGTSMIYIVDKELRMNPFCAVRDAAGSTRINALRSSTSNLSVSLDKPYGITKDSTGSLYVTSYNTHQIFKMVQDPGYSTYSISVIVGNNIGGFNTNDIFSLYATLQNPSIIQVLPDNSFYFIDTSNKMIRYVLASIYDTFNKGLEGMLPYAPLSIIANNTENTYNTTALTGGEETSALLNNFTGSSMCVDFIGNIYVSNTTRNNVLKFDTNGNVTAIVTGLSNPKGISIYNNSVLYISDNGSNTIKFVSINRLASVSTLATITDPQLNAIYNMGYLFTIHPTLKKISVYNIITRTALADINVVSVMSSSAASVPQTPYAIAVDSMGNLFVSTGGIIEKYAINYTGATLVVSPPSIFTSDIGMCPGITYYDKKLYYISNTSFVIYSKAVADNDGATGTIIAGTQNNNNTPINGAYANTTTLYKPVSIDCDINGTMYILDNKPGQYSTIYKINPYNFLKKDVAYIITGSPTSGTTVDGTLGYFARYGLINSTCFGPDGSIYLSDSGNNCIWKLNTLGYVSKYVGVQGNGGLTGRALTTQLTQPRGIIMSKDGILYICDTGKNRVVNVTNINGTDTVSLVAGTAVASLATVNSTIAINTPIQSPSSIIIDNYSNIFVSCANQIIKINSLGIMNTYIGGGTAAVANGLQPLSISITPGQLAINSSNELHFINGNQVLKLSSSGSISIVAGNSIGFSPDGTAATSANLSNLQGLAIDSNNNIYISDSENNRVRIISGGIVKTVAGTGAAAIQSINTPIVYGSGQIPLQTIIGRPGQLTIDSNNRLLITQLQVPQITLIPFTNTNPCGLVGKYIQIESEGQGINILNITAYGSTGNLIRLSNIVALTNQAAAQGILQSTNNTAYISGTTGFNENVLINMGSDTIISFVNIKSTVSLGMKFKLLNSDKNIIYESIISSNIKTTVGEYITFRSIYAQTQCTIPTNLPVNYTNIACGVPNVRSVKLRGNGVSSIKISIAQLAVISDSGANVALGKSVTAFSQPATGPNMVDGYYGSKSFAYESNTSSNEWVKVDLGSDTNVVFIFLYLDSNKTSINGFFLDLLNSADSVIQTRLIQTVPNIESLQYISFDFRTNNIISSCISFNDIRQMYKMPGTTYRNNKIRFVRIGTGFNKSSLALSQIVIKSADDGSNLAYKKTVIENITGSNLPLASYVNNIFSNLLLYNVFHTNAYLEVDLGSEYNISDVIIYTPQIYSGTNAYTYTLTTYGSDRNAVSNPNRLITTDAPGPTSVIYSLTTQYGTPNVRYIKYMNVGSNRIQISQLIVIDRNGINVAYKGKVTSLTGSATSIIDGTDFTKSSPYISTSSAATEYVQIDLGSEYEIVLVKFWNATTNQTYAAGSFIRLFNSLNVQQATKTLIGGSASETLDFRYMTSPGPFVPLTYAKSALTDPYLTNIIRARYIRIENPGLLISGSESPPSLSQLLVYDLLGANIAIGKPIRSSKTDNTTFYNPVVENQTTPFTFNNIPADWWEVDLGDEYSISSFILNSTNPVLIGLAFYNKYREQLKRIFITTTNSTKITSLSLPAVIPPPAAPTTRSGTCARFIRIENTNYNNGFPGAPTGAGAPIVIRQIVAIDARGINVAVGKATRNSNFGIDSISQSYGAVNGTFDSTYKSTGSTNEWWEVDLGDNYDIKTVIYYNDTVAPQTTGMRMFFLDSYRYIQDYRDIAGTTLKQTFNFPATAAPTPLSMIQTYGKKARYVILQGSTQFKICQLAIIDCLGRNIAIGKTVKSSNTTITTLTNGILSASILNYTTASNITIDLGEEYYITNVIGYSFPPTNFNGYIDESSSFNMSLNGITVILQDAYRNQIDTKTFTTECCSFNVTRFTGPITNSTYAPPFGNTTQYCPTKNMEQGGYLADNAANNSSGLNAQCHACPTGTMYDGVNGCFPCPSGYIYDTNYKICKETKAYTENMLKSDNGVTLLAKYRESLLTKRFAMTTNMRQGMVTDWATPVGLLENLFYTNGQPRTISNIISSWTEYINRQVINVWEFQFSDRKPTMPGGVTTDRAFLWDTSSVGRPMLTQTVSDNGSRTITIPSTVTPINTIIPSIYYNTQYYQKIYDTTTKQYYYIDIPIQSYLIDNAGPSNWNNSKVRGATHCQSLDFTGYTVPPLPQRRASVYTNLTADQTQSNITRSWATPVITATYPYTLDPGTTQLIPTEPPLSTSSPVIKIPSTFSVGYNTNRKLYRFNALGTYKFSGASAMGTDYGRFGLSFLNGDGYRSGFRSDGSYIELNGDRNYLLNIPPIYSNNFNTWWTWYSKIKLGSMYGYNPNAGSPSVFTQSYSGGFSDFVTNLSPTWADSARNYSTWNQASVGTIQGNYSYAGGSTYNPYALDFTKFNVPNNSASIVGVVAYSNLPKFYYYNYALAGRNANQPYIEISQYSSDGQPANSIYTLVKRLNEYGRVTAGYIPSALILMVGQTSGNILKIPVYSNGWYWDELAKCSLNSGGITDLTRGNKAAYADTLLGYSGPYSQVGPSNVLRLPILSEFFNLSAITKMNLAETYKMYYIEESGQSTSSYSDLYSPEYMIDDNSSGYGIRY
jgi:sugar lactone lactonase YvrE